ncbi:MAG: hypothetical protein ACEQSK_18950 [Sphingomonadaceae bacterium]
MCEPDKRQRGISLIQVAIVMASLAAIAMAALMSMRHEHNYFTDMANQLLGKRAAPAAASAADSATSATSAVAPAPLPGNVLRKCQINGKTVLSDVDCAASNPTSTVVRSLDTRGIEAPRVPKPDPAEAAPQSATDKMIEKATR